MIFNFELSKDKRVSIDVTDAELREIALAVLKEDAVTKAHMRAQAAIIEERRREFEDEMEHEHDRGECDCEHCDCNHCEEAFEHLTDETREALLRVIRIL